MLLWYKAALNVQKLLNVQQELLFFNRATQTVHISAERPLPKKPKCFSNVYTRHMNSSKPKLRQALKNWQPRKGQRVPRELDSKDGIGSIHLTTYRKHSCLFSLKLQEKNECLHVKFQELQFQPNMPLLLSIMQNHSIQLLDAS